MTDQTLSIFERAYEQARSGYCPTATHFRRQLRDEKSLSIDTFTETYRRAEPALPRFCNASAAST